MLDLKYPTPQTPSTLLRAYVIPTLTKLTCAQLGEKDLKRKYLTIRIAIHINVLSSVPTISMK